MAKMNTLLSIGLLTTLLSIRVDAAKCRKSAGCLDERKLQTTHWISALDQTNPTACAKACEDMHFSTFSLLHDCFCSHRQDLTPMDGGLCEYEFHETDCDDRLPSNNLCPDPDRFYCQYYHPIESRINYFMSFMTLNDKVQTMGQMSVSGNYSDHTPLVARDYVWWSESLHGLDPLHNPNGACGEVCPTSFAEANALSCSWNASLWHATATAISTEARAYFNQHANDGLTFYAPNINLASHPLWGRVMETPGEDPFLASVYAKEYIKGLQGDHPRVLKAAATPKHFVGHFFEGEKSDPWGNGTLVTRLQNDTRYSQQDLEQYYLPPFRAALKDAKAESLMCAYQSVNGVPMCANGFLLNRVVRQDWNWSGFVVSDCDAIESMESSFHGYSLDPPSAVHDGIRAGCDQNCGGQYKTYGMKAVNDGRLTEKQIDTSIRRQLRTLFRLGLFDAPDQDPYGHLGWEHVGTDAHRALALEGARQSIVLLQNGNGTAILPFNKDQRIVLAGPMANATAALLGNYHGAACPDGTWGCLVSLDKVLAGAQFFLGVPPGCRENIDGIADVVTAAKNADVVVLVLGGTCNEWEGKDRDFLGLPGSQMQLFQAVYDVGKPVAVVIVNGGPYSIDVLKDSGNIAILQAGFPGQAGAQAIADVLTGVVNPSGKLTTTIYPASYANGKPMRGTPWMDSNLRPGDGSEGRTHMFYTGSPLFQFGHGLSYTEFEMDWDVPPPLLEWHQDEIGNMGDEDYYLIRLTNTGSVPGREVVQAYWSPPIDVDAELKRQLFDFRPIYLHPGESQVVQFSTKEALKSISTVTPLGDRVVRPGTYTIHFSRGHGTVLQAEVKALSYRMIRKFPSPWVDMHEVVGEACIEGSSDIVPHTESFLTAYKNWKWVARRLQHVASKMCLTYDPTSMTVNLQSCDKAHQKWKHDEDGLIRPKTTLGVCLLAMAHTADQLRMPVKLSDQCSFANAQWTMTQDGLLRSMVHDGNAPSAQEGLCLAARSEGRFNYV